MRFILYIVSLLLMFQPVSWAFGAPMYGHGPMEHDSVIPTMLMSASTGDHCHNSDADTSSKNPTDQMNSTHDGQKDISCVVAGASAFNFVFASVETFIPRLILVGFDPYTTSFNSYIESPEIRPPHNIRP